MTNPLKNVTETDNTYCPNPADSLGAGDIEYILDEVRFLLLRGLYGEAREKYEQCFPTNPELSLSERIRKWIEDNKNRTFYTQYLDKELQIVTERDRTNRRQILKRFMAEGKIAKGKGASEYRIIECGKKMDWLNADDSPLDMVFPLGEEELVEIYPKNTILYAGSWQSGKTAYFMNMAWMNRDLFDTVTYFMSELGKHEVKKRLRKGEHIDLVEYDEKITIIEQSAHFEDAVIPDGLNFIDYLSVKDNFHEVAGIIESIDDALTTGIAVVAIQKPGTRDYGYGGEMTGNRPRLYVALERGRAKILKGKNWKRDTSPDGLIREYKIFNGMKFEGVGEWHPEYDEKQRGYS